MRMHRRAAAQQRTHAYGDQSPRSAHLLVLERGSRGPSTVTLMALLYEATCGGLVDTVMVSVKLLPAIGVEREIAIMRCSNVICEVIIMNDLKYKLK